MKISLFILLKYLALLYFVSSGSGLISQSATDRDARNERDTSKASLNMDATYNRPFLTTDKMPVAIGGYIEANSIYSSENGLTEGLSFQARRLTIFMSTTINRRIKFISELEFEDGAKEIAVELAAVDVEFQPAFNLRGGVIVNPIGGFNQNHDGPKWEFVERPDVSANMLPATWSTVGFGAYGKMYNGPWTFGYEAYLTNGFDDRIIDNDRSRTYLPASKENKDRFEESGNGRPLFTGKIALKNRSIGEIGFSYMGGIYNKFQSDGFTLDEKRNVDIFAIDIQTQIKSTGTTIFGEWVYVYVDVPETYTQQYGTRQKGGFIDIVQPIRKGKMFGWENASVQLAMRLDYVDWNVGKFVETGTEIGDEIFAITPALTFRPSNQTVFRLNYRYEWQQDLFKNPVSRNVSWLFGFSTYF